MQIQSNESFYTFFSKKRSCLLKRQLPNKQKNNKNKWCSFRYTIIKIYDYSCIFAHRNSLFRRAMCEIDIAFGHSASQA